MYNWLFEQHEDGAAMLDGTAGLDAVTRRDVSAAVPVGWRLVPGPVAGSWAFSRVLPAEVHFPITLCGLYITDVLNKGMSPIAVLSEVDDKVPVSFASLISTYLKRLYGSTLIVDTTPPNYPEPPDGPSDNSWREAVAWTYKVLTASQVPTIDTLSCTSVKNMRDSLLDRCVGANAFCSKRIWEKTAPLVVLHYLGLHLLREVCSGLCDCQHEESAFDDWWLQRADSHSVSTINASEQAINHMLGFVKTLHRNTQIKPAGVAHNMTLITLAVAGTMLTFSQAMLSWFSTTPSGIVLRRNAYIDKSHNDFSGMDESRRDLIRLYTMMNMGEMVVDGEPELPGELCGGVYDLMCNMTDEAVVYAKKFCKTLAHAIPNEDLTRWIFGSDYIHGVFNAIILKRDVKLYSIVPACMTAGVDSPDLLEEAFR